MTFEEILYNDSLLDALDAMQFSECTPVQEQAIPVAESGRDLMAIAQTGTGKTAAYLLPVLDCLADGGYPEDAVNCVIMAPTRELVQQIDRQAQGFAYFLPGISSTAIYGGTDGKTFDTQKQGLVSGASIVIATPGRLLAHLSMGYVDLSKVSFFILDEADRMLDMGFFDDIMQVVARLPKERQTLMYSATMPPKIRELAKQILIDPVEVRLAVSKPAEKIEQSAYFIDEGGKEALLLDLFKETPPERVIVFSSSKQKVKQLTRSLRQHKIDVAEMHSDLEQTKREQVMLDFRAGRVKALVATDIVARGIDIDDITMVLNYDVPMEAEDYVHRVGRTARAERDGRAITFVTPRDRRYFDSILRLIGRDSITLHGEPQKDSRREGERRGKSKNGPKAEKMPNKDKGKRRHQGKTPKAERPTQATGEEVVKPTEKKPQKRHRHRGRRQDGQGNGQTTEREKKPTKDKKHDIESA